MNADVTLSNELDSARYARVRVLTKIPQNTHGTNYESYCDAEQGAGQRAECTCERENRLRGTTHGKTNNLKRVLMRE